MSQAYEKECFDLTFPAAGTCTKYGPVKLGASGVQDCGAGEEAIGIAQSGTTTTGRSVRVRVLGVSKVTASAAISAGAKIQASGSGKVATATALDGTWNGVAVNPCGKILSTAAGADGDIVEALVFPYYFGT
ncbi:MAG: DUF2190 family protein [Planctomycetes bacterium]|nr:DUF2190 family protein [Planctomycetota bacterium]